MAAQKGRDMLLKYDSDGAGTFVTIAGLRDTTITIDNEPVDITNKDSQGFRDLLAGGGTTSLSISGSGVFKDESTVSAIRSKALNNNQLNFKVVIPGTTGAGTFTGQFMLASFEEAGEFNGEVTYSLTLESSGVVTFA